MFALLLAWQIASCPLNAVLIRAIDGDTYELEIALGFDVSTTVAIRLADLDTPERYTPEGRIATKDAEALLLAARVTIIPTGDRTFARWVAYVYIAGVPLADWLRSAGHVKR